MKSLVFKSAWKLVKELGYTLSEALTVAWKAVKENVNIVVNKAWNGTKVLSFSFVSAQFSVFGSSVNDVLAKASSRIEPNNEASRFDYKKGVYNGD